MADILLGLTRLEYRSTTGGTRQASGGAGLRAVRGAKDTGNGC